ncbi:MAG: hypothetical protein KAS86_04900, partial [Candidatus Omnitrophica bacterium]|nr:hypothetical protein [Candidatus Omnitrophota bacterium]
MKTKLTKLGFAVFLILIGVTLTVCNAHALDPYPDTTPLVGVSSDGGVNITQRTTFDWNETPWTKVSFLK